MRRRDWNGNGWLSRRPWPIPRRLCETRLLDNRSSSCDLHQKPSTIISFAPGRDHHQKMRHPQPVWAVKVRYSEATSKTGPVVATGWSFVILRKRDPAAVVISGAIQMIDLAVEAISEAILTKDPVAEVISGAIPTRGLEVEVECAAVPAVPTAQTAPTVLTVPTAPAPLPPLARGDHPEGTLTTMLAKIDPMEDRRDPRRANPTVGLTVPIHVTAQRDLLRFTKDHRDMALPRKVFRALLLTPATAAVPKAPDPRDLVDLKAPKAPLELEGL